MIEAAVEPLAGLSCVLQTSSVDCDEAALPSYAGRFMFLLPADTPNTFHISFKFKSLLGNIDEGLIDEVKTPVTTHYPPKSLCDFWDGHSLPAIDSPFPRKQLCGEFVTVKLHFIDNCLSRDAIIVSGSQCPGLFIEPGCGEGGAGEEVVLSSINKT